MCSVSLNVSISIIEPVLPAPRLNIGIVDVQAIRGLLLLLLKMSNENHNITSGMIKKERYAIGKYAAENSNINTIRIFQIDFPNLSESIIRTFKKRYYEQLREKSKEDLSKSQRLKKYSRKTGRPYLLGELDGMVRKYLFNLSKKERVINTTVANATVKALMSKYPYVVGQVDVCLNHQHRPDTNK